MMGDCLKPHICREHELQFALPTLPTVLCLVCWWWCGGGDLWAVLGWLGGEVGAPLPIPTSYLHHHQSGADTGRATTYTLHTDTHI